MDRFSPVRERRLMLALFAVALALRIGVPIHAEDSVLEEAGLIIPDEQEDEVEKFREFLDSVSPEDFRGADT